MTAVGKHPELVVWTSAPLNAETPLHLLDGSEVTPKDLFYVRNHGPVPEVDPLAYRLEVGGLVRTPLALSLEDLRDRFEPVTTAATLACAGNRRAELASARPIRGEIPWGAGALGTATWAGVRLRDVLDAAGVAPGAAHVAFTGLDGVTGRDDRERFGGSIPLAKARESDVILAWAMNGDPLTPEHGFPLRVVVPGYVGARSVKWIASIVAQAEPSTNYFQAHAYRLYAADGGGTGAGADRGIELGELSVTSAVCRIGRDGSGALAASGYALAGGARVVERVDVSVDGGATWTVASLAGPGDPGVWRLWRAALGAQPDAREVIVRAWDSAATTQPEDPARLWNPKGYMNNAWHRARVAPD